MIRLWSVSLVIVMLMFPAEAGLFKKKSKDKSEKEAQEEVPLPALKGPKKLIAVHDFENKVEAPHNVWWNHQKLGRGMSDMLVTSLMQSNYFIVLERESLEDGILKEQDLAASGRTTKKGGAQMGKVLRAQILIKGAVTIFEEGTKGGSKGGKVSFKGISLGLGGGGGESQVGVDIRVFDTSTGQVLAAKTCKGIAKSKKRGLSLGLSGRATGHQGALSFGGEKMEKSPLGDATRHAITSCVRFIIEEMNKVPWSGRIMKVTPAGKVYINCGKRNNINIGNTFSVYELGESFIDEDTGENLGSEESLLGQIKVDSAKEKFSICSIVSGKDFTKKNIIRWSES